MKTAAIICEYNPFHNGHLYQINKIREDLGQDTAIIAIMSGNYVQRGDVSILDKGLKAKIAVLNGVNLVLELPFPYSLGSAEFFAKSAIHIIEQIKVVDYLSFGSECGNSDILEKVAETMMLDRYKNEFRKVSENDENKALGFPKLCEIALNNVLGDECSNFKFTPNNILAIEYIKAIKEKNLPIKLHTVKREGADFLEEDLVEDKFQSATAIRNAIMENKVEAYNFMPENEMLLLKEAIDSGDFPCDKERINTAVLSYFRLNSPESQGSVHDVKGGLYNRLKLNSFEANDINTLIRLSSTKKYTTARIRRSIWYSFFGVTSSDMKEFPMYTQSLAMDAVGRMRLKDIRKRSDFPILTKPSATKLLSETAKIKKSKADIADSIFELTKPVPKNGNSSLRYTPFIKD